MAKKKGLGMGLEALFEDNSSDEREQQTLRMSEIEPNKNQPRRHFDNDAIATLAESIKQHGLIQPLLVRPKSGAYQIVAGERRWRACKMLGLSEVPVVIKNFSDSETVQLAIIENIQREDLNPIEEACAYRELINEFGMTQDEVAKSVGKSRPAIANSVRLLNMPEQIQDMLRRNDLSAGQAKAIAAAESEDEMLDFANKARNGMMTVRSIEKLVAAAKIKKTDEKEANKKEKKHTDNYFKEMELSLFDSLKRKVEISTKDGKKGTVTIDFFDKDDLYAIAEKLTKESDSKTSVT